MCLQCRTPGFDPWVRKIPWKKEWLPTPAFLPGEFHGQRSLVGYSPWGHKELNMLDWLTLTYFSSYNLFAFYSTRIIHLTLGKLEELKQKWKGKQESDVRIWYTRENSWVMGLHSLSPWFREREYDFVFLFASPVSILRARSWQLHCKLSCGRSREYIGEFCCLSEVEFWLSPCHIV